MAEHNLYALRDASTPPPMQPGGENTKRDWLANDWSESAASKRPNVDTVRSRVSLLLENLRRDAVVSGEADCSLNVGCDKDRIA
jgi:hypothetical protein